jgi:hypothetical protein
MRKIVVFLLVGLLVVVTAGPAVAAKKRSSDVQLPGEQYFTLVGLIRGTDSDSITVFVKHGNRFIKRHVNSELPVEVTADTVYRRWTPAGCVELKDGLDAVPNYDTISIHGFARWDGAKYSFEGTRVTVDVPLLCCP